MICASLQEPSSNFGEILWHALQTHSIPLSPLAPWNSNLSQTESYELFTSDDRTVGFKLSLAWSVSKLCLLSLKLSHFFLPLTKLSYLTVKKNNYWIHSWYSQKYMKYIFFWCHLWVGLKVMQYSRSSSVSQKQLKEKGFQESDLKMQLNCKEHRESEYSTPQLFNFQPSHIWLLTLYNIVVYNESFPDQFT